MESLASGLIQTIRAASAQEGDKLRRGERFQNLVLSINQ